MPKKVIISVTNDIVTDQRVLKVIDELIDSGADVTVIGRELPWSLEMESGRFRVVRYRMLFKRGFLFYKFFNIRLLFTLIRNRCDILISNDLDTLLPNYIVSKLRAIPLVYDAHEYFTGVPELESRPLVKNIWKYIERLTLPGIEHMMTVNDSIAMLYKEEYGVNPVVIRNFSRSWKGEIESRKELGIEGEDLVCIIQGTGLNLGRGGVELIDAISGMSGTHLVVLGRGDQIRRMKERVLELGIINQVTFLPVMRWEEMMGYTAMADVGLSLDNSECINYSNSLPNKIFDYMSAGIAIIATNLFEVSAVINDSACGILINKPDPAQIKNAIERFRDDRIFLAECKKRSAGEASKYQWESERGKLRFLYGEIGLY